MLPQLPHDTYHEQKCIITFERENKNKNIFIFSGGSVSQ
tara:strand:- start:643 stop:759 length:117 start_codon:yes stop_codon:yes gene_type:complete